MRYDLGHEKVFFGLEKAKKELQHFNKMVKNSIIVITLLLPFLGSFNIEHTSVSENTQTVLISEVEYKNGIYLYEKKIFNGNIIAYYENKKLKFTCEVFDGRLHGITKEYFDNGEIKSERNFYLGRLFGSFTQYFENGEVQIKGDVKNLNYHGGEEIENLTVARLKKGKVRSQSLEKGKIIFLKEDGDRFKSSEEVPIFMQNRFIITSLDEKKTLLQVK